MPRTGGDYVWVSRILSPPLAVVSNFAAAFSALIGATFWARYFPVFAPRPGAGHARRRSSTARPDPAGARNFQTDKWWIFVGALVMMRADDGDPDRRHEEHVFRWQNSFWAIASVGTFIAFIVFAFGSLVARCRALQRPGAQASAATATSSTSDRRGRRRARPRRTRATWSSATPGVFVIMTFMMWNWWSVYLAGELKSASNRNRQMGIMFGALIWDVVFLIIGVLLIYKVAGYSFMAGVNVGSTRLRDPDRALVPLHRVARLQQRLPHDRDRGRRSLFWSLPAMVGNTFMPVRTVFAWSFDRLLPEKFAEVNERTHSPVPAILLVMGIVTVMLALERRDATTFQTWLALGVLAGVVCVWIVCVAAFVVPRPASRPVRRLAGERRASAASRC